MTISRAELATHRAHGDGLPAEAVPAFPAGARRVREQVFTDMCVPADVAIELEKTTNDVDADDLDDAVQVAVGEPVTWSYHVTNSGDVPVREITVVDSEFERPVRCPRDTLGPQESMTCAEESTAEPGLYGNRGEVTARSLALEFFAEVSAEDSSHYFGVDAEIALEKATNGQDADTPPGPMVAVGGPVTWTYVITNRSNGPLRDVSVSDDQGVAVTCPDSTMPAEETMTCTATGPAVSGQYVNEGRVTGTSVVGETVSASDSSHYFGNDSGISLEKLTNGQDADTAPGPTLAVGGTVTWSYVVTNTGNGRLTAVGVTDDKGVAVSCPDSSLPPGGTMTCSATGTVMAGQYANVGVGAGTRAVGGVVSASDSSHYFGSQSGLTLEKSTNGVDADTAPGPTVAVGTTVTWAYVLTNTGSDTLTAVAVTDDQGVAVSCPATTVAAGAMMTCTATGTVVAGQYANVGTGTGTSPLGPVAASDPSHYFGSQSGLTLEKSTNGVDADTAPGPTVAVGATVTWAYVLTNTGSDTLTAVAVTDDQGVAVSCPATTVAAGAMMTCTATGTVVAGQYANVGTATGTSPLGPVTASDPSHYFGSQSGLTLEKSTNGVDADTAPGPTVAVGTTVTWAYVLTNTGSDTLTAVAVTDDQGVAVSCPATTVAAGAMMTCTATGTVVAGQYANVGTATGTSPLGPVTASDPSHYFGSQSGLTLEKSTNGVDADTAPGPTVAVGATVTWAYVLTNTGSDTLTAVAVTDDQGVAVSCPATTVAAGAMMTCTATGTVVAGQYANVGTATGTSPLGPVTASDPSHYFGAAPTIDIEKQTNLVDADTPIGPLLRVGDTVTWSYVVTNTGNVALTGVSVVDDRGVAVTCPATTLAVAATMTCSASGTVVIDQYANVGTATGTPPVGSNVTDSDPSHYFGAAPAIDVQTLTDGADADTPPGPSLAVGSTVTWVYQVENTGNVDLSSVAVTDDRGVTVTYPSTTLPAGVSMLCSATGTVVAGLYANVGTATGTPPVGANVTDSDPSHHTGVALPE